MRSTADIMTIRNIEDTIRATKRFTQSLGDHAHPDKIQGADFSTLSFRIWYRVYLDVDFVPTLDSLVKDAWKWAISDVALVSFYYDYRNDRAVIQLQADDVCKLNKAVPGFKKALSQASPNLASYEVEKVAVSKL